jgi:peptidoglycan LD-endopeptidase LytH
MYPYSLLTSKINISKILPNTLGTPFFFDYTDPIFSELPIRDTVFMQEWTMRVLEKSGKRWGIAGYLEDRSLRLRGTHLIDEWRVYHLGVDIIAPADTPIFSPLDGEVTESTIEPGKANYGGYVVVRYAIEDEDIYILYGHLDPNSLVPAWPIVSGQEIGKIGSSRVNGDWTTHLHMQAITKAGIDTWKSKWYCSHEDLPTIRNYCPDPSFLIRY